MQNVAAGFSVTASWHFSIPSVLSSASQTDTEGWHRRGIATVQRLCTKGKPLTKACPQDAFSMTGVRGCTNSNRLLV
jgi:hypothetical protein